jgi:hypothetical protein
MLDYLKEIAAIRSECSAHANRLYLKYGLAEGSPPIGALGICFNNLTIALELADFYYSVWGHPDATPGPGLTIDQARQQNSERLTHIGKSLFVEVMSACEFQAKEANKAYLSVLEITKSRPYLSDIIHRSKVRGLVAEDVKLLWDGCFKIRNCLVHNNGVADETAEWQFAPNLKVVFEDRKMSVGTILTTPRLSKWVIAAYADWCDKFLAAAGLSKAP